MQTHPAQRPIPVLPPDAPDPDLGGLIGVPMHITTSGHPHCEHRACQRHCGYNPGYTVGSEPGKTIEHLVTNVCARYGAYRRADALPRDLQGRVEATEYTFQYSDMKDDMSTWLFRAQTPVAIIHPPNFGHTLITSTDQPRRMSMTMRDMTMHRPGYTVVHLMEATWGHGDAGSFGWYQYDNGAIRVYNWRSFDPSGFYVVVAWKNPGNEHWFFDEAVASERWGDSQLAAIIILCGIAAIHKLGRTLFMPTYYR